jgi:dolichyl-phosphate beta-glucosyltransferase
MGSQPEYGAPHESGSRSIEVDLMAPHSALDPVLELSIVIPAYNEAERIGPALETIAAWVGQGRSRVELVLVDDGSSDDTATRAELLGKKLGLAMTVLRHTPNRGKGFAVQRGMLVARAPYVLFTDADLSVSIDHADAFIARARAGADVVVGSRRVEGAKITVEQPRFRVFLGTRFRDLARWLLVPGISDFTCGFKLFRHDAAQDIFAAQRVAGWGFDVEILLIAFRQGWRMVEEPVEWRNDRRSRVRLLRDISRSAWELLRIRWYDLRGYYRPRRSTAS